MKRLVLVRETCAADEVRGLREIGPLLEHDAAGADRPRNLDVDCPRLRKMEMILIAAAQAGERSLPICAAIQLADVFIHPIEQYAFFQRFASNRDTLTTRHVQFSQIPL